MSAKPEISAEDMVTIEIDGVSMQARKGSMIIHAADDSNIYIPRFCYHKKLPIAANCRMCLVEVEKVPKPLPACATPVAEGMKIFTRSEFAKKAQESVMEVLLINHPLDCPICDQGGECELQDIAMGYGGSSSRFAESKRVVQDKNIGPLIATEMTRCIHCTRCIRTLELVNGESELGAMNRGNRTTIGTYIESSVDSEMSGNIIDVCPVGALTAKPSRFSARAWEMRAHGSIAAHDCVGSNINVHTYNKKAVRTVPAENEAINEVWISDRDRYAYEALNGDTRLTTPMIKVGNEWQETDWNTALDEVGAGLRDQGDAIGCLVSPNVTTEEAFLAQRLLRGLGSQNIDHRIGQQDFSDDGQLPLVQSLGCSIDALESVNAALLIGANIGHDQSIVSHRLRKNVANGGHLMLMNLVDSDKNFPVQDNIITCHFAMANELVANVKLMVENDRLIVMPAVAELFEAAKNAQQGTLDVQVTAAFAMDSAQETALADALKAKLGREVRITSEQDPELIGGVRIRAGDMVIAGHGQHAAMLGAACEIGVLEGVAGAVDAGALAVPHGEHAVVLGRADQVHLLRTPDGRGRQVCVDARHELHVVRFQLLLGFPQVLVEAAQGRAAVAGNEPGRVEACGLVAQALHHGQAHEGLDTGQEDGAGSGRVFVVEADGGQTGSIGGRRWRGTGVSSERCGAVFRGHGHGCPQKGVSDSGCTMCAPGKAPRVQTGRPRVGSPQPLFTYKM
mgnify:CR=1 FL=1